MNNDDHLLPDTPAPWETREDAARREHAAVQECARSQLPDWYQDAPEITLPHDSQPNWRTVH